MYKEGRRDSTSKETLIVVTSEKNRERRKHNSKRKHKTLKIAIRKARRSLTPKLFQANPNIASPETSPTSSAQLESNMPAHGMDKPGSYPNLNTLRFLSRQIDHEDNHKRTQSYTEGSAQKQDRIELRDLV
jgi:hypothetical protein